MKKSLGVIEACPGERCAFWEDRSCAFRNLPVEDRPEVAEFLLGLRDELERARAEDDEAAARHRFYERLNAGRSD